MLGEALALRPEDAAEHVPLDSIRLPEPATLPEAITEAPGIEWRADSEQRIRHAAGRSYPDLIRLRTGRLEAAPDAVAIPTQREAVEALLGVCSEHRVAVVPFGGGTSVVGGVDPLPGSQRAVISVDLRALRAVEIDRVSLTARLGPGLRGPEAEAELNRAGLTLGHFPQSFEQATIGGFAATRSAGQASSGYGRFDELVTAVELAAPAGTLRTLQIPHTAAGPSLRELVLGSEGALGVITEVSCRLRPAPERRSYEAWIAPDFTSGREICRELAQNDLLPEVLRLSDEGETAVTMQMAGGGGARGRALDAYLGLRRRRGGCLLICGWEGEPDAVRRRRRLAVRRLRRGGAVALGASAGRSWERGRYEGPYLRDTLLALGVMVETLETAHSWSRVEELYRAVAAALRGALGERSIVTCHLSHAYPDGASLYFTFLARAEPGEELEQWRRAKSAASEAIVSCEATITHHHAIGRDHAAYMRAEVGELGLDALRAVKERLDPAGVMNPGKLLGS
jgi:alkyldihydroxyacetonephosphate synthase